MLLKKRNGLFAGPGFEFGWKRHVAIEVAGVLKVHDTIGVEGVKSKLFHDSLEDITIDSVPAKRQIHLPTQLDWRRHDTDAPAVLEHAISQPLHGIEERKWGAGQPILCSRK